MAERLKISPHGFPRIGHRIAQRLLWTLAVIEGEVLGVLVKAVLVN